MIGINVKIIDQSHRVKRAADKASFENLGHAAASIRKWAIKSIKTRKGPSPWGQPVHTRSRRMLPRSIFYSTDRDKLATIIGPVHSKLKIIGEIHEFGLTYMGTKFPQRSFMGPALDENRSRMPSYWLHSVGE